MDQKLFKNYLYNILFQLVKIILPLIMLPYYYQHLTAPLLGLNSFIGSIAAYFIIFGTLGVNIYGNREIAKVKNNKEKLSKTFLEILSMQILNMAIVSLIYLFFVVNFIDKHQEIYLMFIIVFIASAFDITWFFYGVEDFKHISLRNIAIKLFSVILILFLVKKPEDLLIFIAINSFSELCGQLIMFLSLKKYLIKTKITLKTAYQNHFKNTIKLFIPTIAISIYTLLDRSMLGLLLTDKSHTKFYEDSQGFVRMFLFIITSIGSVMLPRITNIIHNDENADQKVNNYLNITLKIALALSIPICFAIIVVSPFAMPWYLKDALGIEKIIAILSLIIILISLSNVFGIQYLIPSGNIKIYTTSVILGASINFILNLFLIPNFYAIGAAIATVIAEFSVSFYQYRFIKKTIKLEVFNLNNLKYLIAAFIMAIFVYLVGFYLGVGFKTNLVQAIIGIIIYPLILIITKEKLILQLINKFKNKL